ncbi:unnamed protein product [Larinioides sclopetarius]|uniref:Uncharacterized protein n=1 Tax=Larinioides sclopetarius TaxID=280406 RepID=A0AAV1Z0P7_9ARAC
MNVVILNRDQRMRMTTELASPSQRSGFVWCYTF